MRNYTQKAIKDLNEIKALALMVSSRIDEMVKNKDVDEYNDKEYASFVRVTLELKTRVNKMNRQPKGNIYKFNDK